MLVDNIKKTVKRIKELEKMLDETKDLNRRRLINSELKIQKNSLEAFRMLSNK